MLVAAIRNNVMSQPRITARIERTEDDIVHTYELDGVVYDSLEKLQAALDGVNAGSVDAPEATAQ